MSQALAHIAAYDAGPDDDGIVWKTMNGTAVPFKDGESVGRVGEKIKASGGDPASGKSFADYKSQFGGDHYKAAQEFYKNEMMDKPARTEIDGQNAEVQFAGGKDRKKMWQNLERDPVRAEALQYTREVIESGQYLGKATSSKDDDRFVSYHYFQKEIPLKDSGGQSRKMIVDVGKKKDGAMEYRAHSFIHNKEPHYGKKIEVLRGKGMQIEDRNIKRAGNHSHHEFFRPNQSDEFPASDKNINPSSHRVNGDRITFDRATHRKKDENGFLHVEVSHISKETVNPYYGREVPGWEKLGLDPERVYRGYRKGEELARGAETFNGLPLLLGHYPESAEDPQKEHRVGSLGTSAAFKAPYLDNSLIITDATAIEAIESGEAVELSSAYRYEPDFTPGEFNGERYDFIMTNIRGNHVALVEEGRAGPDVAVADEQINPKPKSIRKNIMGKLSTLAKALLLKSGLAADEAEVVEAAEKLVEAIGEEVAGQALEGGGTNFDEEAAKILQDEELDEAGKVEALKKLAEGLKDVAEAEKQTTDNEPAKQPEDPVVNDSPEECAELMKAAGIDPADEAARAAFMSGMKASKGATDEDPGTEDEGGDPDDKKPEGALDGKIAKKSKPLTAQDAALIRSQAKTEAAAETKAHFRSLTEAARAVRNLCGEVDPLAFDSAADIYRHALKASGRSVATKDTAALKDMVGMALDAKANATVAHAPAFDTRKMDGAFSGLNRITIQQ